MCSATRVCGRQPATKEKWQLSCDQKSCQRFWCVIQKLPHLQNCRCGAARHLVPTHRGACMNHAHAVSVRSQRPIQDTTTRQARLQWFSTTMLCNHTCIAPASQATKLCVPRHSCCTSKLGLKHPHASTSQALAAGGDQRAPGPAPPELRPCHRAPSTGGVLASWGPWPLAKPSFRLLLEFWPHEPVLAASVPCPASP